ncbi:MAG: hypothetical protein ACI857_000486 [Arenicella sp.]|jgi:hypothetical protein
MKRALFPLVIAITLLCGSCGGDAPIVNEHPLSDTLTVDTLQDTLSDTLFTDSLGYVDESLETENLIEAIYGEQWEFCDCVIKNDSINKVVEKAADDADYDAIFDRMDVIDGHCKSLLTTPNTTPEERERHERKVRKCLRNA